MLPDESAPHLHPDSVFGHVPGTDDPLLGVGQALNGATKEFYWVTDGQGRQYALAEATGWWEPDFNANTWPGFQQAGGITDATGYKAGRGQGSAVPGVSYFRNRIYDQQSGQWTQEDPLGLAGGINLYQYAAGNPAMFTDPFGLCPERKRCRRFILAHLNSIDVKQGETIDTDHILGTTGNTGRSTGPHLHYESGTVGTDGSYTPDMNGGPSVDGCPVETGCTNVSSSPDASRCLTINGETQCGHQGTDVPVPTGTEITATPQMNGGRVERAGWQNKKNHEKGYGQRIVIDVVIPASK